MKLHYEIEDAENSVYRTGTSVEASFTRAKRNCSSFGLAKDDLETRAENLQMDPGRFATELFGRIYAGTEKLDHPKNGWELGCHDTLSDDSGFQSIRRSFIRDESMAALATATFMNSLDLSDFKCDESEDSQLMRSVAMQKAASSMEEVLKAKTALDSMGLGPGDTEGEYERSRVNLAEKLMLQKGLRDLVDMAGRMQRANSKSKKKTRGGNCITDIEVGGDITKVLPSELALMGNEHLRLWKMSQILEGRALQYKAEDAQEKNKGPIWMLRDVSSSMRHFGRNQKAATIAFYAAMEGIKQKRPVKISSYSYSLVKELLIDKPDPEKMMRIMDQNCSGGTSLEAVLRQISSQDLTYLNKADLIIVTDGYDKIEDIETVEKIKKTGARVILVAIGSDGGFDDSIKGIADTFIQLTDEGDFIDACGGIKL